MSQNISSNGLKISISAIPFLTKPLLLQNLSADSDVWVVNDIETAGAQTTPDGASVFWSQNARIEATLNLSGASKEAKTLSNLLQSQQKYGGIPPVLSNVTVVVYNEITEETETYIDGVMTSGSVGTSYGNQKKNDKVFNFSFGKRI